MKTEIDTTGRRTVAVIVPVFNEEDNLPLCVNALSGVFSSLPQYDFKTVFVDDGSTDRSWEIIISICAVDGRFSGARLSRNFGSHAAIAAGFDIAEADAFIVMACDLQDPPENIPAFIAQWENGAEVVFGARRLEADGLIHGTIARLFYTLMNRYAAPPGAKFTTGSFFLVGDKAAKVFRRMTERNRLTFAMLALVGFPQATVAYDRAPRRAGKSGWSKTAKLNALGNALMGYSRLPSRIMFITSIILFLTSAIIASTSTSLSDRMFVLCVLCFFFSIQFSFMGLIASYLRRIHSETVERPLYVISAIEGMEDSAADRNRVVSMARKDNESL